MKWPTQKAHHAMMKQRQEQNLERTQTNPNENWADDCLVETGLKWTRQAQWGFRLFDFWNSRKGIAVEIDGREHNKITDAQRDAENYKTSGIIVLRVRNGNEQDMGEVITTIASASTWNDRRKSLGKHPINGGE